MDVEEELKTVTVEAFKKLKEDMYKIKSDNDINMNRLQSFLEEQLQEKIENVNHTFNTVNFQILDIQNSRASDQNRIEKIPDLLQAKKDSSDDIFTLNIKVSNLIKDLSVFIKKYDQIYLENLELPGVIGENYQFKKYI